MKHPDLDDLRLRADRAIAEFQRRGLDRKNLFWMAKVSVDEDQWSDVLAHLLSPAESHGMRALALAAIRDLLFRQGLPATRLRALDIAIESSPGEITVTRELEVVETRTRPDIVIEKTRGDRLTICIENKKLLGAETVLNGELQTRRQERWLKQREADGHAVLGILISPGGRAPSSGAFVSLDTGRLVRALRDRLGTDASTTSLHVMAFLELIESTHT